MDRKTKIGTGCGQKAGQATPTDPPRSVSGNSNTSTNGRMNTTPIACATPTPSNGAAPEPVNAGEDTNDGAKKAVDDAPQRPSAVAQHELAVISDKVFEDQPSDAMVEVEITYPPSPLPRLSAGMNLLTWLKLVVKPEEGCALDQFELLTAYHDLCDPPHVSNEALVQILLRIFSRAKERDEDGKLWMLHLRWLNASELALCAGNDTGCSTRPPPPHGVSTDVRENTARVMDYLLTVGGGKLPTRAADGGGPMETAPSSSTAAPSESMVETPQNLATPSPHPETNAVPQTVDEILASRPKRDFDAEFESIKAAAPYESMVKWLKSVVVKDLNSFADPTDVVHAYKAWHADGPLHLAIEVEIMYRVILDVFPHAQTVPIEKEEDVPFVKGLRWNKIESQISSMALPYAVFPEKERNEAHKLLHVPDPERTKLWLKSLFVEETEMSLSLPSMWEFYERIFWRWVDTHPHLEKEEFSKVVAKTFRKCVAVEVSDSYHVLVGLRLREESRSAKEMLARQQKQNLRRLQRAGEIDPPKTAFAQKLLDDPLLMRVRRGKNNCPISGSYVRRTRLRGGDPETREKKPLGDEEPGFPGLSMKRQQVRFKRELEECEKQMAAMQQDLEKQASGQIPDPNAPPY